MSISPAKKPMLSETASLVIKEEEFRGDFLANRFRYLFIVFLVPGLYFASSGEWQSLRFNALLLGIYVAVTILHTLVLSGRIRWTRHLINSVTLGADFFLFISMQFFYQHLYAPGDVAFMVKNPGLLSLLLPILFASIQFRISLLFASAAIFFVFYFGLIIYGLRTGMPLTGTWVENVLGRGVLLGDKLTILPTAFLLITLVLVLSIKRTRSMVIRIGTLESHKSSMSRYFSPAVVEEITKNPDAVDRVRRQKVTILFLDILGFTTLSEKLDPSSLVAYLSRFREKMVGEIFKHHGTVDKFVGDAVMATFGTPHPSPVAGEDSRNALAASFDMLTRLREFNLELQKENAEPWKMGIGLHTGEVIAGTVGFDTNLEYTVIGDAVNTASRIEGLCKTFNAELLISEEVYRECGSPPALSTEETLVKGKERPVRVYRMA